ncbi:hypothetical protein DY000_02008347 [Brassica cretica]|uniref:Disease resistance protein winged helix domain-containing protein n=1 Tax=Brassica cretica TaxID=69181 RepID=A0ABQ7C496_BRACR|nr:hypothetical protein DY000_02008347 [Brassica cretica]
MKWVDEDLQRIGKEMVQKCGGLQLAIVVLTGLMSRKRANEWNDVCASLWRRLKDNSIHISTVFDLSYKELKLCFLYLSVFPEDYETEVEQLIHIFVAERFIQEDEGMMMEDVARYFIEELIDRSLGGSSEKRERESLQWATFFYYVVEGKWFYYLINNNDLCDRRVNKRMPSFLFFGEKKGMLGYVPLSLPDAIGDLIHLRYLGIADADLEIYLLLQLDHELLINLRGVEIYGRPARISTESEEDVIFFPSLESLTLDGTTLKEDPMPALQKLPRLQDLVLKECEWSGAKMSIGEQGFGRLRKLELITVRLDELEIEEKSMPSLLKLNLEIERGATKLLIPDRLQAFVQGTY